VVPMVSYSEAIAPQLSKTIVKLGARRDAITIGTRRGDAMMARKCGEAYEL
jgi:hypothetical protein